MARWECWPTVASPRQLTQRSTTRRTGSGGGGGGAGTKALSHFSRWPSRPPPRSRSRSPAPPNQNPRLFDGMRAGNSKGGPPPAAGGDSIDARSLFDGAPLRAPPEVGADGITALPDEVLHHVLGFLEAQESVRTCVLARRWRHLWKSAIGLRIVADEGTFLGSVEKLCSFMDSLLEHHQGSPLHTFKLMFTSFGGSMSVCLCKHERRLLRLVNTWFWHAVRCQAQVLSLNAYHTGHLAEPSVPLDHRPVNSRHLTRLELHGIVVNNSFLDFSNCPLLEQLEFKSCSFEREDESLPRLRICAPSLVTLLLDDIWRESPMLESMPSLVRAFVATDETWESCDLGNCNCKFCDNSYSIGGDTGSNGCVLLKGLSEAQELTLISGHQTFIFKSDLRSCPIFSKLKILFLNDYWCVPDDYRALVCILERSPVLEKLTLSFSSEKHSQQRERKGSLKPMEGSAAILEHLKIIKVLCHTVDERICKLTLFLCAFHIRLGFY